MEPKVYFFYLSGAKKGKIEVGCGRTIRIGRQPYCEIQLDPHEDIPASGEHARVIAEPNGTFTLHDLDSSWGTFKNEIRIHGPVPVTTGDVITCGQDDIGQVGPKIKFYLQKDILRCPICEGPVYKRHFKCPRCKRKHCLRCIDFQNKLCKSCSEVSGDGYEIVPDDEEAARPARVIVSGKDAARIKKARTRRMGSGSERIKANSPKLDGSGSSIRKNQKRTKVMQGRKPKKQDPGVTAEPLRDPGVIAERVPTKITKRDLRRRDLLFSLDDNDPSGSEPMLSVPKDGDLVIPDMSDIETADDSMPPPPPPQVRRPTGRPPQARPNPNKVIMARPDPNPSRTPNLRAQPVNPPTSPTASRGARIPPESKIHVRRPAAIPCERCKSPLDMQTFFICDACRSRLCANHRGLRTVCDRCVAGRSAGPDGSSHSDAPLPQRLSQPPPPPRPIPTTIRHDKQRLFPPKQDLVETADDASTSDSGSGWGRRARQDFIETADDESDINSPPGNNPALAGVKFECPYCDRPLAADARHCRHCNKLL